MGQCQGVHPGTSQAWYVAGPLPPDDFCQKYALEEEGFIGNPVELGVSNFGSVFRGTRLSDGTKVAVKFRGKDSPGQNFTNEVYHLGHLKHPNLIEMMDFFDSEVQRFMVLPLATGGDLLSFLNGKASGTLEEVEARRQILALMYAVEYCHRQRVAHRDIKPENLLLTMGKPAELRLSDFETATNFHESIRMTENVGTVGYSSPQMLQGAYTKACDIWSCGCVLYAMLSGQLPFDGITDDIIIKLVKNGGYDLDGVGKQVSSEAKELIRSMLCYKEDSRTSAAATLQSEWLSRSL